MSAAAGELFSDRAPQYARSRPTYPAELADWLASVVPRCGSVWEAGCGSGQLTALLAERFDRVIATDASPQQIAHAPALARATYLVAAAESAPIRDASCDLVVAAQAAHWFELPGFFGETRRVARAGGIVALVGYGIAQLADDALQARFVRFHDAEIGRFWPPQRRMLLDGYASIDFPFDEIATPALTLTRDWTADEMIAYVDTWSAVRVARRARVDGVFDRFAADLHDAWGDRVRRVTWPLSIRAGRR